MKKVFFSEEENFKSIIEEALPNEEIKKIIKISTGWTNIVYNVKTEKDEYFFRFPRDEFWSRTIVKDYEFAKFIYGKTDFNTVNLQLKYDKENRPFSMHKKIEGSALADKIDNLTADEIKSVSNDIAKFMFQLHNIEFVKNDVFDVNNLGLDLEDFLGELLEVHVSEEDKEFWKHRQKSEINCLVHGDLNSSNVLLDENNKVVVFIDFGFGGFGNKYDDISRIISRKAPDEFKNNLIKCYENYSNSKLNDKILENDIYTWKNIDNAYINYMKKIGIYE